MKRTLFTMTLTFGLSLLFIGSVLVYARRELPRDGAWIAFVTYESGDSGLYRMLPDGSKMQRIVAGQLSDSTWSPRGDWLLFANYDARSREIDLHRVRPGGQGIQAIHYAPLQERSPGSSPNGRTIIFSDSDGEQIYMMSDDGRHVEALTEAGQNSNDPAWSPDGQWIVFTSSRSGSHELYKMRPDGSDVQRLTNSAPDKLYPSWSPDGEWIAFTVTLLPNGNDEIYIIRPDGSDERNVTVHESQDRMPTWSPHGQWLVFTSNRAGKWQLFRIRPDGSEVQQLTNKQADHVWPSFSPFYDYPWHSLLPFVVGSTIIVMMLFLRRWKMV